MTRGEPCTARARRRVARKGSFAVMEAAGREAPAAPAAEALLSLGSDVRVGMGHAFNYALVKTLWKTGVSLFRGEALPAPPKVRSSSPKRK